MSKQGQTDFNQSNIRKKIVKSTDLKRRLFEVGLNLSPNAAINSPLLNTIASPKRNVLTKHPLTISTKQEMPQLLKFQPSNSPQMSKTSKDFQIRKSPKQMFFPSSPANKNKPNATLSSFYQPDSIRGDTRDLKTKLLEHHLKQQQLKKSCEEKEEPQSKLDEYVSLVLRGIEHIDQFLYLVRGSQENIYELQLVNFQLVRQHEGQNNFQYYTVSKKGFCHYVGGKPHAFLDILEWSQEKSLYMKIKALKFFYRFRRWKTLQMWRRTITKQRRQSISHSLIEKLFILQPTARVTLLQLRKLTLQMEKSVLIIAKNEGTYTLQSFKHSQERARREASLAVQQYSRQSRTVVRKCFENKLSELRQNMKKKTGEDKSSPQGNTGSQSPKQSAFQALGFPSKMTYQHRSKLRKQAGKFLRFSYLVDSIHLSCLAGLYSSQVSLFISRLEQYQLGESVKLRPTIQQGKDQIDRQRMFILQLICNFKEIPQKLITQSQEKQQWSPSKDIRLRNQERGKKYWIPRLSEFWLNLQPNLDEVLDELGFLIRQGLGSLKCFQKWARHRQMQKYVSILQQWDDLVSENWQISENDNLDPLLLLDSLDPAFLKLKMILKTTQSKLLDVIKTTLTDLLNAYWEYSQLPLLKLQSQDLANPAQTFEQFLMFTSKLLERVTNQLPHRIELGVISVQITKIKTTLGQKFAGILQNLKAKLPQLVQDRTNVLNNWLTLYGTKLREEILNIDDFVKIVQVIKQIQKQFGQRRQQCNELAQLYQTMQQFRMDTRRRKDFETVTLKLKDQLEQLIITAEQNIERKTDLYTRQVLKYHLPSLVKDINKALENVEQPRFLKLDSYRAGIVEDLQFLQNRQNQLLQQRSKCQNYMNALKIQGQKIGQLNQLSTQISSRVELWKTLEQWQAVTKEYQLQSAKNLPLTLLIELVQEYKNTVQRLQQILPPNQILNFLKQSIKEYYVYLPILNGFTQSLSQNHWTEIYDTLPQKYSLDLKKRQFSLQDFLKSGIGVYSKEIQSIFQKCRVEAKLQRSYQQMQDSWQGLVAKIKTQGKFMVIANGEILREELDKVLFELTSLLSNPHAQSLKQYSITYQSVFAAQESFDNWLWVQNKIVQVQRHCRLLDIKKLPDYNFFQNAERLYKQITKSMSNKGAELGVKIGKLLVLGIQEKLNEIDSNLSKIEDNIKGILRQHRRVFPSFYLFHDNQLIKLITEQSRQSIQWAAKKLIPSISRLEFQNQRISAIITIDEDKFIKNPISINSQIQQILFQITETTSELNRRALRNCRYKAVENNLSGLVEQYNIQHLLAISRVDFSHYTTISIDNQQDTPDSLAQFRKVMRKDTAEDIKNRHYRATQMENSLIDTNSIINTNGELIATNQLINTHIASKKNIYLHKYDTLLLQQLLYQEILDYLIKNNISRAEEYPWASQLKFFWEDTPTDQPNITIKQMHLALKYGNQFIGSHTKVILQNEPQTLLGLKYNECVVYNGSKYNIERLVNAIGYKMLTFTCTQLTTQHQLNNFIVGSYFAEYIPFLKRGDQLPSALLQQLPTQKWIQQFRSNNLKRNSPYLREMQRNQSIFLNVRGSITGWQSMQGTMRIVHYAYPKKEFLRCNMRLRGMFSDDRTSLLLRIFEAVAFLQQKSKIQGVSLQQFLDILLSQGEQIDQRLIFFKVLDYLKPKVSLQTHHALTKHIESLALLPFDSKTIYETKNKIDAIFQCMAERKIIVLTGRGYSKKYFVKEHALKLNITFIELFAQNIQKQHLFATNRVHPFQQYIKNANEQHILYFQAVTSELLLSLENLLYTSTSSAASFLSSKTKVILDISSQQKLITPRELTSFPILHFECPRDYINSLPNQWLNRIEQQEKKRNMSRIIFQIIIPTLQNLTAKDEIILQEKVTTFLNYLSSLYPFKNVLDASIYALVIMYRASEEQHLKLQYLVKKHLGQDKLSQDTKISNLFFKQANQQKIITDKEYLKIWMEENEQFNDQTYILTPSLLHQLIITRRIHEKTDCPILLEGPHSSGKTALLNMYRKINHQNSFYMHISAAEGPRWNRKLTSSLQRHGLNIIGARINYQQSIVMVEDLHLADSLSLKPLQLMLFYSKCTNGNKDYNLRNVKFMLSAQKAPERLQKKCLKITMNLAKEQIESIFNSFLNKNIDKQWQLSQLFIQKIANTSIQLCQKIVSQDNPLQKQTFSALRRVLLGFSKLKIKQGLIVEKEIQKFWCFTLLESLKFYDQSSLLQTQLKKLDLANNVTILSYTHLFSNRPSQRKMQFLKDTKRLYNLLNEKIEKYNESDTKRYGESFQFLNFDPILQKIITISHSILLDSDHLIIGRRGTGKESLAKLSAFLNGHFYKTIKGSIKSSIIDLIEANVSSPHLIYKSISTQQDQKQLHQYYYCDFESEILSGSESKQKASVKQKQKEKEKEKEKVPNIKSIHKNMSTTENYTIPKAKLTQEQVIAYKKSFRLIASLNNLQIIKNISPQVRSKFHIDVIDEVPAPSILQYNQKLINVDGITCNKDSQLILSQLFQYSRQKLGLSLRSNDDCVRLFSSFLANLVNQMVLQEERYSKMLNLLSKMRNCYAIINEQVGRLHSKLKELSQNSENSREIKISIETELREKSTAQSISEKLTQILSWLEPLYTKRLSSIKRNLDDRSNLEITFAVTASYFIYLSSIPYENRRKIISDWYRDIPLISKMQPIQSFLSLFLLYEEQFNAEPVDHLPQFYENMAIIFHSAKPIAIRDRSLRGRFWLEKNCSFYYLREDQKDFTQLLRDYLSRSSNILIEVIEQQTLNKITETLIGTLLFLPQSVSTVNLKGEQVQIHQQAKVYLLLAQGLVIGKDVEQQFTVVLFDQSEELAKTAITHQYYSSTQREYHISKLDYHRKIRSLNLDCENAIGQIADSIYEQLCGSEMPPQERLLIEKLNKMTDKLMVRAQNQFTKIKEKQALVNDLRQKYEKMNSKILVQPAEQFYTYAKKMRNVIKLMSNKQNSYTAPSYAEYFHFLKAGLQRGLITSLASLMLSVLRQWGPLYTPQHYTIFAFLLLMVGQRKQPQQFVHLLNQNGIANASFLELINIQNTVMQSEEHLNSIVGECFINLFKEEQFKSIGPIIYAYQTPELPLIWHAEQTSNCNILKVVKIRSSLEPSQIKQRILLNHSKIIEPTEDDALESLLKRCNHQDIKIIVFSKEGLIQAQRVIRQWPLLQKTTIFLHDNSNNYQSNPKQVYWQLQLSNGQSIFSKVVEYYKNLKAPQTQEAKQQASIQQPINFTNTSVSHSSHSQHTDYANDNYWKLLTRLTNWIKWKHQSLSLPIPLFNSKEIIATRKLLQNNQSPLKLAEKVSLIFQSIYCILNSTPNQICTYIKTLQTKIMKICSDSSSEQEFLKETLSTLTQPNKNDENKQNQEKEGLQMELGWLIRTRGFFCLQSSTLLAKYIREIQDYIALSSIYNEAPTVTRGSKRQLNIKNRKDSISKKGRQSQSLNKRSPLNKTLIIAKTPNSPLASQYLLKESEYFEHILYKIHKDLEKTKEELLNIQNSPISERSLSILLSIMKNQPIASWKLFLSQMNCSNMPLSLAIKSMLTRRNEIYTYYNKFSVSESCELQFRSIRYPIEFLRAYFRSEITTQDTFMLATLLTPQQAERGDYLRVNGMWGLGWRLTPQGIIQNVTDNKLIQMTGCYLIKKPIVGVTVNGIDVLNSPENPDMLIRVYALSKKAQNNSWLKLYLKSE